jgi:NaMN:DMB phosphoribosyltransferase
MKRTELVVEAVLWRTRLVVIVAVFAIALRFETPRDLLLLAGGVGLLAVALYLSHAGDQAGHVRPAAPHH